MNIREHLQKICKDIESREGVKILFAIESGSRAWRMESADSDYDVRFVYVRPTASYLSLNKKPEVITDAYNKFFERVPQEGCFIDIEGFDLFKFCKMLYSSNPTVIEWLMSDIVWYGVKPSELVIYAQECFSPLSLYCHYKSMCRQNYIKYIKSRNLLTYKKYLYAMRGLVNAKVASKLHRIPIINFYDTVSILEHNGMLDAAIAKKLLWIIQQKKEGNEQSIQEAIPEFDKYIETFLNDGDVDQPANKSFRICNALDKYILEVLGVTS